MGLGPPELLIILVIVLVLFGSTKLPKLARSLGQAQREFKAGVRDADESDEADQSDRADTTDRAGRSDKAD